MWSRARTIAPGDTVIIYMTRDSLEPLVVSPGAVLHNKWGVYPHDALVGLPYGSKVRSSAPSNSGPRGRGKKDKEKDGSGKSKESGGGGGGGGFIYVLRPTPELWTLALPHRTQILYLADIAFVMAHLNIGPGRRVVEAGTGSGSFSHSVARAVRRDCSSRGGYGGGGGGDGAGGGREGKGGEGEREGRLYTFEFHEQRAAKARVEFRKHGLLIEDDEEDGEQPPPQQQQQELGDQTTTSAEKKEEEDKKGEKKNFGKGKGVVRLEHRNVCKDGFGDAPAADGGVDAVFLDLPAPWEAVGDAKRVMRKDNIARICCFSPCIEQVMRTVTALNDAGFSEITMFETLLRPHEVSTLPKAPSINDAAERLKVAEAKREEKRLRQIRANREAEAREKALRAAAAGGESAPGKRKQDDGEGDEEAAKRARTEEEGDAGEEGTPMQMEEEDASALPVLTTTQITSLPTRSSAGSGHWTAAGPGKLAVSKALPEVRGHTSYLTFASLVPYEYAVGLKEGKGEGKVNGEGKQDAKEGGEATAES